MSNTSEFSLALKDADHTRAIGAMIGKALLEVDIRHPLMIHLNGDLGAGKTTLVGGMLHAMGFIGAVRSPTYTLLEPYEFTRDTSYSAALQVMHMDLYRLTAATQLEELGVRDMLVPNTVLLIEWPDRAEGRLPAPDLEINLAYEGKSHAGRTVELVACSEVAKSLLEPIVNSSERR